uniref:RRM domain-containing protein n=1 Tax=Anopheles farauti TaxID=69004 RepID=A0A182R0P5_9DIPT
MDEDEFSFQTPTMSSSESDASEPTNASATPTMASHDETAASVMLTDSENTNNENRVIEMESNPGTAEAEVVPASGADQQAETPSTQPVASGSVGEKLEKQQTDADGNEDSTKSGKDQHAEHVTYNAAGEAIYTDPATKYQYRWCKEKSEWVPIEGSTMGEPTPDNPYENEHYRWCHEKKEWLPKVQDPTETEHYRWDKETQKWIPKQQPQQSSGTENTPAPDREYGYEDGVHTYKDKDGAVYFWDEERKAWFPKVDDDFMAMYQLNYGFIDNTSGGSVPGAAPKVPPAGIAPPSGAEQDADGDERGDEAQRGQQQVKGKKRKAPPEPPKWFDMAPEHNTKVYVSNLPTDISEEEFGEVMSKCGMVMKDPKTHKLKLKLYREADGTLKGDGLCHYIKLQI